MSHLCPSWHMRSRARGNDGPFQRPTACNWVDEAEPPQAPPDQQPQTMHQTPQSPWLLKTLFSCRYLSQQVTRRTQGLKSLICKIGMKII